MLDRISDNQQLSAQLAGLARQRGAAQTAQAQLASGQRADSYADLGTDSGRLIDLTGAFSRQEAYAAAAQRVGLLLERQGSEVGKLRDSVLTARDQLLTALASGTHAGIADAAAELSAAVRNAKDAAHEGRPLFGDPAAPKPLIADGRALDTAFDVSELAAIEAVIAEAEALSIGRPEAPLGDTDTARITALVGQLADMATTLVGHEGRIGTRQAVAERAAIAAQERADMLTIAREELNGVDAAEAITRLTQAEAALQASYTIISRLQNLNLTRYL